MKKLVFSTVVATALGLAGAGCTSTTTPASPTVSFTSPLAAGPSNGTSYKFKEQPVTVSITNAVTTGTLPATYSLEVATDAGFANKIFTRDGIAEGGGGKTAVTLSSLTASSGNVTYYWRWKASVDGTASPYSSTQSFVVQQQIIVGAPSLVAPASGATLSETRPTFTVKNGTRQGAVGAITYIFQLARDAGFTNIVASPTVPENFGGVSGQTSFTPSNDLPDGTIFWRAQARDDSNAEASAFTTSQSFTVEPFDPKKAQFYNNPPGVAFWPETAKITSVDFSRGDVEVDFDRRTGSNAWREVSSGSFGPLQYTLGMCLKIGGGWHCSAAIQFWFGRDLGESGPAHQVADNWYYDTARWGPMTGHQPQNGELVAIWVGQGNLRGSTGSYDEERSNFLVIRFGENYTRR